MRLGTKAALTAALLAGVTTAGFSAMPQDNLAALDMVIGKKLVAVDGSTIVITPSEGQLAREIVAHGIAQKTLFTFLTENLGTVSSASDPSKVIGTFRITDAGINVQYADGSTETLAVNDSGGITSESMSAASDDCLVWYPENHVFSPEERQAAFRQFATRLDLPGGNKADTVKTTCLPARAGTNSPAEQQASLLSPEALREIAQVEDEIDRIEKATLDRLSEPPDNQVQQIQLVGKALLYDKQLSVNRNEACAFCHLPEAGFTGPVPELNRTTGIYPGSVRTRFGFRKPQSQGYAPLSPVLHVDAARENLVGGNFWDMRATGQRLGNPAAEQAEMPPVNPVEMGLPDAACAVYRASQRPYGAAFKTIWGAQAFAIEWPSDVEQVCNRAAPAPAGDPMPVHLNPVDRGRVAATFDQMAQSIASYEASPDVSAFTSKFDAVQAGKAQFTAQEQAGLDLFRGKAKCSACHTDSGGSPAPFTNFTGVNTGIPANRRLPYYAENRPDALGFVANPAGPSFIDGGVGKFLAASNAPGQLSAVDSRLVSLAPANQSRFQVPTLRNVDKRPNPGFVKAYGHNGYFKDLKTIVHFYNTRDVLRRCQTDDEGEGTTCWPAPESTGNIATTVVGRLGLTDEEEDAIVAFMRTLTDGFSPPE
jgi:cytochrome c peroxidase